MADETQVTVPVIVTNFPSTKTTEDMKTDLDKLFILLNGKNYKERLNTIDKNIATLSTNAKEILNAIKGSSKTTTNKENVNGEKNTNINLVNEIKKIADDVKRIERAISNVRNGGSSLSNIKEPPSSTPRDQDINQSNERSHAATREAIKNALEKNDRTNQKTADATIEALKNAQAQSRLFEEANAINTKTFRTTEAILGVGEKLFNVFTQNFRKVFDQWDRQTALLKENGMGGPDAAELNRMTGNTMRATEELLGWNVSIDKAIRSTNDMMAAGMNPRYVRENNKQFIMGLESAGFQLQPDTIREFGNAVFDATHVKELTEGWARLVNSNTENAISKEELSRYLGSQDYKTMQAVIMRNGEYGVEDIQREMQTALESAVRAGFTSEDAIKIAQIQTQARLGGGAITQIPENISSLIGAAQLTGTFTDLAHLAESLEQSTKVMQSDMQARGRMLQASAGMAVGGDLTLHREFTLNDGHTRRMATTKQIEEGQYEGLIPRMAKSVASLLPAESMGNLSQRLTGDSGFFTNVGASIVSGIGEDIKSGDAIKTMLLTRIANNTAKSSDIFSGMAETFTGSATGKGAGGAMGNVSKQLGSILPNVSQSGLIGLAIAGLVTDVGLTVTNFFDAYDRGQKAEEKAREAEARSQESYSQESQLRDQLNEALKSGNEEEAEIIAKQLKQVQEKTDQELISLAKAQKDETSATIQSIVSGISYFNGPLGALAGYAFGDDIGDFLSDKFHGTDEEVAQENRQNLEDQRNILRGYADGGIVTTEQIARVAEGNNPELILPLTNPDRSNSLLNTALSMYGNEDLSLLLNITRQQKDDVSKIKEISDKILNQLMITSYSSTLSPFSFLPHFADGGIVNSTQAVVVGENNNPELILPLTNPDRARALLEEAALSPDTDKSLASVLSQRLLFARSLNSNYSTNSLLSDVLTDILQTKSTDNTPQFDDNLFNFNPFGLQDRSGNLEKYSSMEMGVQDFISRVEATMDNLNSMNYKQQLDALREQQFISQMEYNKTIERNQNKLVDSLDELNRSVQENNRLSRNNRPVPNITTLPGRRYV